MEIVNEFKQNHSRQMRYGLYQTKQCCYSPCRTLYDLNTNKRSGRKFGVDISKMKEYESICINGIPEGGYELVEHYDEYQEPEITRGKFNHDGPELDKMTTDFLNKH